MKLLDGKLVSESIYNNLKKDIDYLKTKKIFPKLAIFLIGNNPASLLYVKNKIKIAKRIGIRTELYKFEPKDIDTKSLIEEINRLNDDKNTNGILVQLPLPKTIDSFEVIKMISEKKDVDGFTVGNLGKMFLSFESEDLSPCTAIGIIKLLEFYNISIEGKEVVVVGRSNIVGKPVAVMFINRGATVTVCHSKTTDLKFHTSRADILVVAVGKCNFITSDMIKDGAVVVDVGINRDTNGKLCGDVKFDEVKDKVSFISPVPGGCGLLTIACLMENVVKATIKQNLL